MHKIRLDEIAAKETYFAEDFAVPDRLKEFEFKYEKFRENDVDFKQNKVLVWSIYQRLNIWTINISWSNKYVLIYKLRI